MYGTDRQQLVIAQGCQTYSQYADVIYAHESKDESNLDVIGPGAFLSMTVPLVVFFAFQRYFVNGVLAGSTK